MYICEVYIYIYIIEWVIRAWYVSSLNVNKKGKLNLKVKRIHAHEVLRHKLSPVGHIYIGLRNAHNTASLRVCNGLCIYACMYIHWLHYSRPLFERIEFQCEFEFNFVIFECIGVCWYIMWNNK